MYKESLGCTPPELTYKIVNQLYSNIKYTFLKISSFPFFCKSKAKGHKLTHLL